MSEHTDLVKRVTALEVAVARLQSAIGGIANEIELANGLTVQCAECLTDLEHVQYCNVENCPCGLLPMESEQ